MTDLKSCDRLSINLIDSLSQEAEPVNKKLEKTGKTIKDLREDSIVYVAAELFLEKGIGNVKMTDVAEAAGVGVASLYRWYGTKDGLVIRAGALLWRDLHTLFHSVYEAADFRACAGIEQIRRLFGGFRRFRHPHPAAAGEPARV